MHRRYRYYDLLLAAFVVVLLCSNFIGAGKLATVDLPVLVRSFLALGFYFSRLPIFLATS